MMHRLFLIGTSTLLLCGCAFPLRPQSPQSPVRLPVPVIQTGAEVPVEPEVTPEPFIDPLATSTGATFATEELLLSGGTLRIGSANAPRTMELFINHDSRYSKTFHDQLMSILLQEFVIPGTIAIEITPLSLQKSTNSEKNAALILCAAAQGKAYAMHEALFLNAAKPVMPEDIDAKALTACSTSLETKATIASQQQRLAERGITVVPTYILGEMTYTGVPLAADIRGQIADALR